MLLVLLGAGEILSDGFWRPDTRQRIAIDPTLWERSEYAIDLRKGDLANVESGETEWRSIVLRAPEFVVAEATAYGAPSVGATSEPTDGDARAVIRAAME